MNHPTLDLQTASTILKLDQDQGGWTLTERFREQSLLLTSTPFLLCPVLNSAAAELTLTGVQSLSPDSARLDARGRDGLDFSLYITARPDLDAVDLRCEFTSPVPVLLNALRVAPPETVVSAYNAVNFRNRHFTPRTYPDLLLGEGFQTTTFSDDWQFAPHPTLLLFEKLDVSLFVGLAELSSSYGFTCDITNYRLNGWTLDYGEGEYGLPLPPNTAWISPTLRLFARQGLTPLEMMDEMAALLIREGVIPDPVEKQRADWWTEPLYCTWLDQGYRAQARFPASLQEQVQALGMNSAVAALDEMLVREAVAVIRRERLPFRTILIDMGWAVAIGQWEPHPRRFPDLRGLVDELHAQGFKVVAWWHWGDLEDTAVADPRFLQGFGRCNRHGRRMLDLSSPATQEEYLRPLFRRLFSSEAGCYDLDGVKTDFLADKIHPEMPLADPEWRGEENYFLRATRFCYEEMKRYKPDAVHIGCSGHFWLAPYIDVNRTYDVHSTDPREHIERAKMLLHTTPGCPVAFDFHPYRENLDLYFEAAQALNASVQIGNILYQCADPFSSPAPADIAYYALLRRGLTQLSHSPVKRK